MPRFTAVAAATVLSCALLATGCSQSDNATGNSGSATPSVGQATGPRPAPFDKGAVKVALVRQSGAGDYFEQWGNGAKAQAKALGIDLAVYDAQSDNAKQATDFSQAVNSGASAIIVDHGFPATIEPLIDQAVAKGITVVSYDVDTTNPKVITTRQSDADIAKAALSALESAVGKNAPIGYVNVAGFAPLDRRDTVWQQTKGGEGWTEAFKVGKVTDSTATDNVPLVNAALTQHPEVKGIFAPYDELAKGATLAVQNKHVESSVKVVGADVSNADIQIITADNSPWVATAGTDPSAVGAAVVRTAALQLAGQLNKPTVEFPAVAITRELLVSEKIANMDQLRKALPELNLAQVSAANWIPVVSY
ncbi:substrate-binding domain-containing protein [Nocardia sp. BMG111209]|uniref:substrate-binding domain-containing protein n=1 Tax=Nocardia sp. BMG111209 TaxID=1160137 RepID=UPI0003724ABF|nr:substrate-binding domain-containing protein [Nocardia sp. BMG111209]